LATVAAVEVPEGEETVSLAPPEVETSRADDRRLRSPAWAGWLVVLGYLAAAFAVTARLWKDPASRLQAVVDTRDIDLMSWYMRYSATAVSHGHLPALISTAMNSPHGISMLWNTSLLLPGIVLAPVTLLAGPQTTLTVVLTLSFAGSAASLFFVLRRWDAGLIPAALGGLVYGFSPAMIDAGFSHYHLVFAIFPPLMIHAVLRIITGRGRPVWQGIWLGLLIAGQFFTGEELLVDTVVAAAVLVVVVAVSRPRSVLPRVKGTVIGLAAAAVVAIGTCGHALWLQFHGPFSETGSPWEVSTYYAHPAAFITPPSTLLFHTAASAASAATIYQTNLTEYLAYLGIPLMVVLVAGTLLCWRDLRVRAAAVTCVVLELFTLGANHSFLPWHFLQHLPGFTDLLANRLAFLADAAAAAVLAFALDQVRRKAPRPSDWRGQVATAVAVLAIVPLIPRPYQASDVTPVPAGWQAAFTRLHLPANATVLVIPIPYQKNTDVLRWQAETGEPTSLAGGYWIGPNKHGQASEYGDQLPNASRALDSVWLGRKWPPAPSPGEFGTILAAWPPAAVVAVSTNLRIDLLLIKYLGRPTFGVGKILVWRR
jgi:hypothetical protein